MKVSIVIPVYYNEANLRPLYADIKEKFIDKIDYDYEIIMVNDGCCVPLRLVQRYGRLCRY